MSAELRTYVIAQVPGWIIAAAGAAFLHERAAIPAWLAFAVFGVWVIKDLLLFPAMRRYYRSEPAERRIVGQRGVALTAIAPRGFIRIRGELWQAVSDRPIAEGAPVRVLDVDGLLLRVETDEPGPDAVSS
jgi:membrane-bound ClpP family serine protease